VNGSAGLVVAVAEPKRRRSPGAPARPGSAGVSWGATPDSTDSRVDTWLKAGRAVSRNVDALTISLSTAKGCELRTQCRTVFPFGGGEGFREGERLECLGGEVSRKFGRVGKPSRRFGLDFESWSWQGGHSDLYARQLIGQGDVSRVDVAWDFEVPDWLTAEMVSHAIAAHLRENGITAGASTEGEHGTYYAGARGSPVRVRIYRKDIQSPALGFMLGPVMRIEVSMLKGYAKRFAAAWVTDPEQGFAGAALKVRELTGLVVQEGLCELPQLVKPEAADIGEAYFEFMKQNGTRLAAFHDAGLDVLGDAKLFESLSSRNTQYRGRLRRDRLRSAGAQAIAAVFRGLLRGGLVNA